MIINSIKRKGQTTYTDTSFYRTNSWKKVRAEVLRLNPYCVVCGNKATLVDHKNPITLGGPPLDFNNLQSMCDHCHNVKRANEKNEKYKKL